MAWPDFEKLCLRLARLEGNAEHWQLYGTPGQEQAGIDVYVRQTASPKYVVWQSKRHRTFSAAKLRAAVKTFLAGEWAKKTERFVLCTSAPLTETTLADAIEDEAKKLRRKGIVFETRDEARLAEELKDRPDLVDDFFGRAWVEAFCGPEQASALGQRLSGREFDNLRSRLADLYRAHFATIDPGVLRAAGLGLGSQQPLPLAARFVPPDLRPLFDGGSGAWEVLEEDERRPPKPESSGLPSSPTTTSPSRMSRRRDPQRTSLAAWSQDLTRAVIVGAPGAGKSTLLRFLVLDAFSPAPRLAPLRERFPAFLPLWVSFPFWTRQIKRLPPGRQISLEGVVAAWLEAHGEADLVPLATRALQDRRVLLFVDGIDEWVDEAAAATAIALLNTFVEARQLPVVVTSRPHGARLLAGLDSTWKRYEIAPFTEGQQVTFAATWFEHLLPEAADSAMGAARALERAKSFAADIARTPQLQPLAEVPLMLGGLLGLAATGASLPRSRFRAYQELTDRLLESHPRARGQAALIPDQSTELDPATRELVLSALAYEVQSNPTPDRGLDALGIRPAQSFCAQVLSCQLQLAAPEASRRARELIGSSEETTGLLVRKSPEEIGFLHRAFQEFLAAKHIASLELPEQKAIIAAHAKDARWRDVLLFVLQSAQRPGDVDQMISVLEPALEGDHLTDWSVLLLLSEVTFGEVKRSAPTTARLANRFFAIIESSPDWRLKSELLKRVISGLSNEQTGVHVRPKLQSWYPDWHGYSLKDALRLMADWGENPRIDDVLWRNLQNERDDCRRAAAKSLGKRVAGKAEWLERLRKTLSHPPSAKAAAGALEAILEGWPNDPDTAELTEIAAQSSEPTISLAGRSARIALGLHTDADRDWLIESLLGEEWHRRDGAVALLAEGWKGDPRLKSAILEKRPDRFGPEPDWLSLAIRAFPNDDEIAGFVTTSLERDDHPLTRHEIWELLEANFKGHPKLVEYVDRLPAEKLDQAYEAGKAAAVAPTDGVRSALVATLAAPSKHLIFWSVDALLDEWGMGDPIAASALREVPSWPDQPLSEVADRLPDIMDDPQEAEELLRRLLDKARGERRLRADKIIRGLQKLGVTDRDASIVDQVLELDLFGDLFWNGMTAAALIHAFPRDPRVIEHALQQLRHRQGLVGVIALMMKEVPEVAEQIISTAAPLPETLRLELPALLQGRAIDDAFSREILAAGQRDQDEAVTVDSAVAHARARMAAGDLSPDYVEMLRRELRAVGPHLDGRRAGAFAAALVIRRTDMLAELSEHERPLSLMLRERACIYETAAETWEQASAALGTEVLSGLLHLDAKSLLRALGPYAERYPDLEPALDAAVQHCIEMTDLGAGALRYLGYRQPGSAELRAACLSALDRNARSWDEAEAELVAAELIARDFKDDAMLASLVTSARASLTSGVIASLCDGWPDSEALEDIFEGIVAEKLNPQRLNRGAQFKLIATKSGPTNVAENLGRLATEGSSTVWNAIPYWLPNMLKRVQRDDQVRDAMLATLRSDPGANVAVSFASLLANAGGLDGGLAEWCADRLAAEAARSVGEFGFDLWLGSSVAMAPRLRDLMEGGQAAS